MKFRAIVLGLLTNIGATIVVSGLVESVLGWDVVSKGGTPEQLEAALSQSPVALALLAIIGLGSTVSGGYVAAHLAPGGEMRHALMTGALSLGLGLLTLGATLNTYPLWFAVAPLVLILPCAALGGWLRQSAPREDSANQAGSPPVPPG